MSLASRRLLFVQDSSQLGLGFLLEFGDLFSLLWRQAKPLLEWRRQHLSQEAWTWESAFASAL